ncbi:sigma-70 family RNA polymerase sigma factor [Candidatus Pacearchaeota archaeon]|nr:sigma-70 family RNA polymerase sigma factor [Candidatus Pacearchaeota archaeon]
MEKIVQYDADAEPCERQKDGNNGHDESNRCYAGGNYARYYSLQSGRFSLNGLEKRVLTREEEIILFKKLEKAKTEKERMSCRTEIAGYNLRLVLSIANDYSVLCNISDLEMGELVDAGVIGLIDSIDKHEYKRGLKLCTHAVEHIKRYIKRTYDNESSLICIPVHMREKMHRIKKAEEDLFYRLKREPTIKEIARKAKLKISVAKRVKDFMNSPMSGQPLSLNTPVNNSGDKEITLANSISGNHAKNHENIYEKASRLVLHEKLAESLKELEGAEKQVLYLRFGLDGNGCRTLDETGRFIGFTRERARQIEKRAIKMLKNKISLKLLIRNANIK